MYIISKNILVELRYFHMIKYTVYFMLVGPSAKCSKETCSKNFMDLTIIKQQKIIVATLMNIR